MRLKWITNVFCPTGVPWIGRAGPVVSMLLSEKKWSTQENIYVMKCYYESKPEEMGYRKRLLSIREGKGLFNVSKQRLCDQVRQIKKKSWLSVLQMEEICREVEKEQLDTRNDEEKEEENPEVEPREHNANEDRLTNEGMGVLDTETHFDIDKTREMSESQRNIFKQLTEVCNPPNVQHIDRKRVKEASTKINEVISTIATHNITHTNWLSKQGRSLLQNILESKKVQMGGKIENLIGRDG